MSTKKTTKDSSCSKECVESHENVYLHIKKTTLWSILFFIYGAFMVVSSVIYLSIIDRYYLYDRDAAVMGIFGLHVAAAGAVGLVYIAYQAGWIDV